MKNGLFGDNDNGDDCECENLLLGLDVPQGHNGHDTAKARVLKLSGRMLSTILASFWFVKDLYPLTEKQRFSWRSHGKPCDRELLCTGRSTACLEGCPSPLT